MWCKLTTNVDLTIKNEYQIQLQFDTHLGLHFHFLYSKTELLTDTKILFLSPNPTTVLYNGKIDNKRNHSYQDYLKATEQYIKENEWPFIDIYRPMAKRMADSSIDLQDTLADGVHPNNIGYYIWFQVMNEYFNQPIPW